MPNINLSTKPDQAHLLLSRCVAEWLCALTGLQAHTDLLPRRPPLSPVARHRTCRPTLLVPHHGERPKAPPWLKRFVAWRPLSYVRLGREVLRAPDLWGIVQHLTRWLADYLWFWTPIWRLYSFATAAAPGGPIPRD